jgi:antitoxin VapB
MSKKILLIGSGELGREFVIVSNGDETEVFIRHDPATGDVVLSRKPTDWQGLLDVVAQNKEDDLLIERRQTHARRDPFEGC